MKRETIDKIKESIKDLEAICGPNSPEMEKVIVKLKLVLDNEVKSKK